MGNDFRVDALGAKGHDQHGDNDKTAADPEQSRQHTGKGAQQEVTHKQHKNSCVKQKLANTAGQLWISA